MNIITGEKIQQLCNVYFGFKEDFDYTKNLVLKGTEQLDKLELTYNTILKEYQKRMKQNGN